MNEAAWEDWNDPQKMLRCLGGRASARKLRLFGSACCRRIWDLLPCDLNRQAVLAVEEYPDIEEGSVWNHPTLNHALVASSSVEHEHRADDAYWAVKYLGRSYYKLTPEACVAEAARRAALRAGAEEPAAQADLLRCLFGNPFRPHSFDQAWRTALRPESWISLAQAAYDERLPSSSSGELDPVRLAILADALEEAGCTEERLLRHCRGFAWCPRCQGTGRSPYDWGYYPPPLETCPDCGGGGWRKRTAPHVRGCFAVDFALFGG